MAPGALYSVIYITIAAPHVFSERAFSERSFPDYSYPDFHRDMHIPRRTELLKHDTINRKASISTELKTWAWTSVKGVFKQLTMHSPISRSSFFQIRHFLNLPNREEAF